MLNGALKSYCVCTNTTQTVVTVRVSSVRSPFKERLAQYEGDIHRYLSLRICRSELRQFHSFGSRA